MGDTDLTPGLFPAAASSEYDAMEAQIKALAMDVFAATLRKPERDINVLGIPHRGSFELIERCIKSDGLALVRGSNENAMRYLFKAWRGRNSRRGLHFLRTYLQLLWSDGWAVNQLWHKKSATYPTALVTAADNPSIADMRVDHYLTSRVNVDIFSVNADSAMVAMVQRALRTVIAARFMLQLRILRISTLNTGIAVIGQAASAFGGMLTL